MFKNANEFSLHIEKLALSNEVTYIDAILEYCEKNEIEPKEISALISQSLKEKIEVEYENLNYLPKKARIAL
jgi:replication initiation and membrane attachment protein DnaB